MRERLYFGTLGLVLSVAALFGAQFARQHLAQSSDGPGHLTAAYDWIAYTGACLMLAAALLYFARSARPPGRDTTRHSS